MVHYNGLASSHTGAEAEILTLGTTEEEEEKKTNRYSPQQVKEKPSFLQLQLQTRWQSASKA
jgi:hypothetical protein